MSIFHGVAGKRTRNPIGVCYHNDAGGANADTGFYEGWLPNHNPEAGFAHAYVAEDGILMAEDLTYKAWHCGNSYGNSNFLSIEICQSMGDRDVFLANEQKALDLTAEWFKLYGWTPNKDTVKLHVDFSPTACPHRSQELHGAGDACRNYFISELNKRINAVVDTRKVNKMMCFYKVKGENTVYWFNGFEVRRLTHPDQISILNQIYKDCYGKEIPTYIFEKSAPWHIRLIQACNGTIQK